MIVDLDLYSPKLEKLHYISRNRETLYNAYKNILHEINYYLLSSETWNRKASRFELLGVSAI